MEGVFLAAEVIEGSSINQLLLCSSERKFAVPDDQMA